jgi:class 3 adenylate cyclase/tetratricopeptide (TPR) repeat protein
MSDLRDWLRENNLDQYAGIFEANDVDLDVLRDLDDADLSQMGLSLGNRRRLMKAISARVPDQTQLTVPHTGAPAQPRTPAEILSASGKTESRDAERRQVTVMFADMVGSTALSGTIDPELLGGLIRRYQDAVAGAIGRYGGFVAKFMGDGVLAYFGFPNAYEDAAERAVRAALGVLSEVGKIAAPDGSAVRARIGIATGLVVVGEIIGTGISEERTIVGETPNLAARLQAIADPDSIIVSESTRNLLGALFELTNAGAHELKGFARPVPVWRVSGEAAIESRFAAIRQRSLPLVGRAHEMGLIRERWNLARQGEGQIVTVVGEAGIGKSRVLEALLQELTGQAPTRVSLQCSPHHTDSPLHPAIQYLTRAAGPAYAATDDKGIEILRSFLNARRIDDPGALGLLVELLSLPSTEVTKSVQTPAQRKAATLALLAEVLAGSSSGHPVIVVLEDAHWADATTLELMTRVADKITRLPVLAVVSGRPEFAPPWLSRPHATLVTLGRLGRPECMQVAASVAAAHGMSAETIASIVAKTDGVPLFVEELTRSVMESAGEGSQVPITLKDSLMARLDRLGGARDVAQIAAVIGREFAFDLLEAVSDKRNGELEGVLARLVASGIVFPEERGSERSFVFKHALVRDAAYESLLLTRRREWHGRIARALEQGVGTSVREPDLLAYHFSEAGLHSPACDYRMQAGDQALSRSAYVEAIAQFTAGLKHAEALPTEERLRRQLQFWLKLGSASVVAYSMQSIEAEKAYAEASKIGEQLGDGHATFQAKWGLWVNANLRRKTGLARGRASELLALAQQSDDRELLLEAYHCQLSTAHFGGDVHGVRENSRHAIELYDVKLHRHLAHSFGGHDPCVCAHALCGTSWQLSEDRRQATEHFRLATDLAESLDHPNSLAHGLHSVAFGHQLGGDREAAFTAAQRAAGLAEKFNLPAWRASSLIIVGWASATGSGTAGAVRLIGAEIANATAAGPLPQYYLGLAAEVLLSARRPKDALAHLDRAIAGIDEASIGIYLPEIYRLRGECLLALDRYNTAEAQSAFAMALGIAKRQRAIIFERRAQESLNELQAQNKTAL